MSNEDDGGSAVLILLIIAAIWYYNSDPKDSDNYKSGYTDGHINGIIEERSRICRQIEDFSYGISNALENEGICR